MAINNRSPGLVLLYHHWNQEAEEEGGGGEYEEEEWEKKKNDSSLLFMTTTGGEERYFMGTFDGERIFKLGPDDHHIQTLIILDTCNFSWYFDECLMHAAHTFLSTWPCGRHMGMSKNLQGACVCARMCLQVHPFHGIAWASSILSAFCLWARGIIM